MKRLLLGLFLLAACAVSKAPPQTAAREESKAPGAPLVQAPISAQIADANITPGKPEIKGGLSSDELNDAIEKSMPGLEYCYTQARQTNPTLAGKMKVAFIINSDGSATGVESRDAFSPELEQCIEKKFSQMKFPTGNKAEVVYPLVFTVK